MKLFIKTTKEETITNIVLLLLAIIIPLFISKSYIFGPVFLVLIFGLPVLISIFIDYTWGILIIFFYGSSIFLLYRLLMVDIPFGVLFDILIVSTFLAMLIQNKGKAMSRWKSNEPVTWAVLLYFGFFTMQIANPNATTLNAWFASVRLYALLMLFYTFIHFFSSRENLRKFLFIWILLAFVIAFYGIFQEIFGLRDFESRWLHSVPGRFELFFIWGHMRVFSLLSDPSAFGLFMTFCGLSFLVLGFGPFKLYKRLTYLILSVLIFLSMSFSGTRTAYAMFFIAIIFYFILNLKNKKVIISIFVAIVGFITVMYGPFYGPTVNRIRSTFLISEDESMSVRDYKRLKFQSYIQTNPLGGGINTAGHAGLRYSPGHPLSGEYDPDSGYLRAAMETGYIGLIVLIVLNSTVLITGIVNHFRLKDEELKIYNLSYIVPFFGLTIAHYTQDAMYQKPIVVLVIATYAIVIKIRDLDK